MLLDHFAAVFWEMCPTPSKIGPFWVAIKTWLLLFSCGLVPNVADVWAVMRAVILRWSGIRRWSGSSANQNVCGSIPGSSELHVLGARHWTSKSLLRAAPSACEWVSVCAHTAVMGVVKCFERSLSLRNSRFTRILCQWYLIPPATKGLVKRPLLSEVKNEWEILKSGEIKLKFYRLLLHHNTAMQKCICWWRLCDVSECSRMGSENTSCVVHFSLKIRCEMSLFLGLWQLCLHFTLIITDVYWYKCWELKLKLWSSSANRCDQHVLTAVREINEPASGCVLGCKRCPCPYLFHKMTHNVCGVLYPYIITGLWKPVCFFSPQQSGPCISELPWFQTSTWWREGDRREAAQTPAEGTGRPRRAPTPGNHQ